MSRVPASMFVAGLLFFVGQEKSRADGPPLVRNDGGASVSNLKFTGQGQTADIRWRRGYYYGYGFGYGYGPYYYGGGPYYSSYYAPYPYYGYGAYPYVGFRGGFRGYGRIGMTIAPPPAGNLGTAIVPQSTVPQFATYQTTPNGPAGKAPANGTAPGSRSYPYDGGPNTVVPLPNEGFEQNVPTPGGDPELPMVPRVGLPISLPRQSAGAVIPIVVHSGPFPAAMTVNLGQTSPRIVYPAYGDPR